MNTQEREQLEQLLTQLRDIKLTEKDAEAEGLILEAMSRQPDAGYLLVQRCLLQNQALQAAQARIAELQDQLQQKSATGNSFLNADPWAAAARNDKSVPGASNYTIPTMAMNSTDANPARSVPPASGAGFGSGFPGNVATTAAGVVAGSFLMQGIGSLLGHHSSTSDLERQARDEHHPEQELTGHDSKDSDLHLASDDDGSFFDDIDSDSDSDWI